MSFSHGNILAGGAKAHPSSIAKGSGKRTGRGSGSSASANIVPASQADIPEFLRRVHSSISSIEYFNSQGGRALTPGIHPVSLITFDNLSGYPSARTIAPLEIAGDLSVFRFYTRAESRKVQEIKSNPKVSLAWQDQRGQQGWITIKGDAVLRPGSHPNFPVDIFVYARIIEAVSYNENLLGDSGNGSVPVVLQLEVETGCWALVS
ncbi:unnamed protein product [Polarella glacialis]|uniref:Pyridoxamine 5'-phosphate oxidase N-terminal domain-containing protein n=1 Tax=Polarella glacialis TaxID=89957 RepID=A0A813LEQ8_POLGL|nr:unnamed protein product [Polarella glacialis]